MSRISLAVVLAALALAACTEQEPSIALEEQVPAAQRDDATAAEDDDAEAPAPDGDVIALEAGDLFFEGQPSELAPGTATFAMENVGNLPHDLVLEELGDQTVVSELQAGETGQGSVELEDGDYTFYCSVPGHRAGGMEFVITVAE